MLEGLPRAVIHGCLCPYLNVYDLCRLMCVSKSCFETFVDDRAFYWIRERMIRHIPEWQSLFEVPKRPKTGLPTRGTWYLIKTLFRYLFNLDGLKHISGLDAPTSSALLLPGMRFAFNIKNASIHEYINDQPGLYFLCRYVSNSNVFVSICFFCDLPDLIIVSTRGDNHRVNHSRNEPAPGVELLRLEQLVMGIYSNTTN